MDVFHIKDARSRKLEDFLSLYVKYVSPSHRTKTNELIDFLENPPDSRKIYYFGLTYQDQPCGFATLMYYPDGMVAIVDHLVVAPNLRGVGAFFSFVELISAFLDKAKLPFDHIVAEVMLEEQQLSPRVTPRMLVRLMRMVGFRVARFKYLAPDPSILYDKKGCQAALLLASIPEREALHAYELTALLRLIYEQHYIGWYKRTMEPVAFATYQDAALNALEDITQAVKKHNMIKLNGMKNLDLIYSVDPNIRPDIRTTGYIAFLFVPVAISIAVGATQEPMITGIAAVFSMAFIAIFLFHPRLYHALISFFQQAK